MNDNPCDTDNVRFLIFHPLYFFQASRRICGAVKSGVREFSTTGFKVMTGCTIHPAPGDKFCKAHKNHESPALSPNNLSKNSLQKSQ